MKRFLQNLFRRAWRRPDVPKMIFRMEGCGETRLVDLLVCSKCKNHFWIELAEIELPCFCAYCGVKFEGVTYKSGEELRKNMPSPS